MQTSASAYERHQAILALVQRYESVRVADLAEQLNVSESTVRNDLETLDTQGYLVRVRGGAIARQQDPQHAPYLSQKALNQTEEKQAIARWAAGMIEDGDIIMLDASSTVLHIAPFLRDRRNLTVFTNGIDVGRALAKEPSNTVVILGGILRPNGNAITGGISKQLLQDYRIQTVFVSCSGFTPELGFFEMNLQEAQMKILMLQASQRRVALLDSSKIGRVGLTTFGTLAAATRRHAPMSRRMTTVPPIVSVLPISVKIHRSAAMFAGVWKKQHRRASRWNSSWPITSLIRRLPYRWRMN
jgi:DeoR/GlpR family transcriptional regulator of sugar metabolism